MQIEIKKFIKKHHVLTLVTHDGEELHTSNMFYAFDDINNRLIFTSDSKTKHIQDILINPNVAFNIVLETKIVGKICGLQANGVVKSEKDGGEFKKLYVKRFPYTALMDMELWAIDITKAKYTDNTLGFGKKLYWNDSNDDC